MTDLREGLRRGVRIAVDVGQARIGVAACDAEGILATPVRTVTRRDGRDVAEIVQIAAERAAIEILVGLPRTLRGDEGVAAREARNFARKLAKAAGIPVRMVDERLSTVTAHQQLHAAQRPMVEHRPVVDQAAAVVILEQALETERRAGAPAGEPLRSKPTRQEDEL